MSGTHQVISSAGSMTGRVIGSRFRIEGLLGVGPLSPVYLARSTPLDRAVALRLLGPEVASDPVFYEMFHAGVQAASRLNHPGLGRVLDCGEEPDGSLFLVTEFVPGRSLRTVIAEEGPLSAHRVAVIFHHALSAVAAAHDAGLVHRALSPDTLFIVPSRTDEGAPTDLTKVCDLPLAALVELDDRGHVGAAAYAGRDDTRSRAAQYVAPEQERGELLDARADIYAMGAVLYELLTGSPPFADFDPMVRLVRRMTSEPPAPRARRPDADATLSRICMRALAPDPEGRYASVREMRSELKTLLAEDTTGRYVLRTGTSVAPPSASASIEPSGVTVVALAGAHGRLGAHRKAAIRAEIQAWTAPAAALVALVVFIAAAFFVAYPQGVANFRGTAAEPPPTPTSPPPAPSAAPDAAATNPDSRRQASPLM